MVLDESMSNQGQSPYRQSYGYSNDNPYINNQQQRYQNPNTTQQFSFNNQQPQPLNNMTQQYTFTNTTKPSSYFSPSHNPFELSPMEPISINKQNDVQPYNTKETELLIKNSIEEQNRRIRDGFASKDDFTRYSEETKNLLKNVELKQNQLYQENINKISAEATNLIRQTIDKHNEAYKEDLNRHSEETINLLKASAEKQNEINMAAYEKQMENAQKAESLQRQVDDLTQTLANVTNNFGKAMSNLSNNLKSTQELLRNQTQTLSFKNEFASNTNENDLPPSSKTQTYNVNTNSNAYVQKKESNLQYIDEPTYTSGNGGFDLDHINPVKIKNSKMTRHEKKELKKLQKEEKKINKRK